MKFQILLSSLPITFLAVATCWAANGDLPYRQSIAAQSRSSALQTASVPVIERLNGPGRDAVTLQAISLFAPSAAAATKAKMQVEPDFSMATGDGWFVEVRGAGEWVRYRNNSLMFGPQNAGAAVKVAPDGLEAMARDIVRTKLATFVKLAKGEELQGWTVSYLKRGSTSASGLGDSSVVASRVGFTRVVNGIPVLGPGSKVNVIIAPDGTLAGFDIDWPPLNLTGGQTKVASYSSINASKAAMLGSAGYAPDSPERVFECGYYDPGVDGTSADRRVGPACVVILDSPSGGFLPHFVLPIEAK
jgi:hypothetical protein